MGSVPGTVAAASASGTSAAARDSGQVSQVRSAIVAKEEVIASDEEEVGSGDEVSRNDGA
ncbi:hypothetical protein [Micromonospora sp. DH14]|uniref:hypothetical protein n=1 Tax=Micromonospora sp. DH14 TaxID=3040120 RepID=UPI0024427F1A|nr:hypothetical protein [Micromonospora sp. DH14]